MNRTHENLPAWLLLAALAVIAGCRSTETVVTDSADASDDPIVERDPPTRAETFSPEPASPEPPVPAGVVTATAAAAQVRSLPALDQSAEREVALYRALYQAAWETNVGGYRGHYLLDSPADPPGLWAPEAFDLELEEFRLRVIAGLAEFRPRFAWTPPWAPERWSEPAYFPGTNHLATRLKVRILDRDDARGIVRAEISNGTAHTGGSRERLTARWRDGRWDIERDPTRVAW